MFVNSFLIGYLQDISLKNAACLSFLFASVSTWWSTPKNDYVFANNAYIKNYLNDSGGKIEFYGFNDTVLVK